MSDRAIARKRAKKRTYVVARILTQAGILGMALIASAPVLTPLITRISQGLGASPLWMQDLTLLSGLTMAGFAATNFLRLRWEADDGLPN